MRRLSNYSVSTSSAASGSRIVCSASSGSMSMLTGSSYPGNASRGDIPTVYGGCPASLRWVGGCDVPVHDRGMLDTASALAKTDIAFEAPAATMTGKKSKGNPLVRVPLRCYTSPSTVLREGWDRHVAAALTIARSRREESVAWDDVCILLEQAQSDRDNVH